MTCPDFMKIEGCVLKLNCDLGNKENGVFFCFCFFSFSKYPFNSNIEKMGVLFKKKKKIMNSQLEMKKIILCPLFYL